MPDTGQWDVPLEEVTFQNGVLAFCYRGGSRTFEGRWDPAAGAWVGKFRNPAATFEVAYKVGFLGLPVLPELDGYWEADATVQGYRRRFKLRVKTNAHGTYALMDMPELVQTDLAVISLARQGNDVEFAVPAIGMRFEGVLDSASGSITGKLDAGGADVPVTSEVICGDGIGLAAAALVGTIGIEGDSAPTCPSVPVSIVILKRSVAPPRCSSIAPSRRPCFGPSSIFWPIPGRGRAC